LDISKIREGMTLRHKAYGDQVRFALTVLAAAMLMAACGGGDAETARMAFEGGDTPAELPAGHPPIEAAIPQPGAALAVSSVAGVAWTVPAGWSGQGPRPMRAATYALPLLPGDSGTAECAVYYFGAGQGGGIEENIDRWVGQIMQPDGSSSADKAKTEKKSKGGFDVTTVDVSGTYMASMGPRSSSNQEQPGYRMLAAIVEGPDGAVFFKVTGPEKSIAAQESEYDALLETLRSAP
jgi:hypothetical protein